MQIEYISLIVAHGLIAMDLIKVAGVTEWPVPKMKKKVQPFLGFVDFYHRFIQGFLHHTQVLFNFMKKDVIWTWGDSQQEAFNELKTCITSFPVLQFADDSLQFCIKVDSSHLVTGAVLSQQSPEDDKWHPISFYSKSLNNVQWNYEIHNKEMLVIIHALEEWCHFLDRSKHKFEIWTDHKNLEYFMATKKLNW